MINTERNRALLTDLFSALGHEGWGEVFTDEWELLCASWVPGIIPRYRTQIALGWARPVTVCRVPSLNETISVSSLGFLETEVSQIPSQETETIPPCPCDVHETGAVRSVSRSAKPHLTRLSDVSNRRIALKNSA